MFVPTGSESRGLIDSGWAVLVVHCCVTASYDSTREVVREAQDL